MLYQNYTLETVLPSGINTKDRLSSSIFYETNYQSGLSTLVEWAQRRNTGWAPFSLEDYLEIAKYTEAKGGVVSQQDYLRYTNNTKKWLEIFLSGGLITQNEDLYFFSDKIVKVLLRHTPLKEEAGLQSAFDERLKQLKDAMKALLPGKNKEECLNAIKVAFPGLEVTEDLRITSGGSSEYISLNASIYIRIKEASAVVTVTGRDYCEVVVVDDILANSARMVNYDSHCLQPELRAFSERKGLFNEMTSLNNMLHVLSGSGHNGYISYKDVGYAENEVRGCVELMQTIMEQNPIVEPKNFHCEDPNGDKFRAMCPWAKMSWVRGYSDKNTISLHTPRAHAKATIPEQLGVSMEAFVGAFLANAVKIDYIRCF